MPKCSGYFFVVMAGNWISPGWRHPTFFKIQNLSAHYFAKFMEAYKDGAVIITKDGIDIGFYNGELLEDTYEIGNICIIPEYQNRGIGTAILKDILDANKDRTVTLQYFKKNPVGRLYERLGFKVVGETKFHYQMSR